MTISPTTVYLKIKADRFVCLFPLMQNGFLVQIDIGSSIGTLLREKHGLDPEFIEERINTVFLDGRPVDDINTASLPDGSTLALSAAMPGLVGATFRRGGYLAPFRSAITYQPDENASTGGRGVLTIKLFNLLIKELGPKFLHQGVYLTSKDFQAFVDGQNDDFWTGCKSLELDDQSIDPDRLREMNWPDKEGLVKLLVDIES